MPDDIASQPEILPTLAAENTASNNLGQETLSGTNLLIDMWEVFPLNPSDEEESS